MSIWHITDQGSKGHKWFGAGGCKWLLLQPEFGIKTSDVFVRAVFEWMVCEQSYKQNVELGLPVLQIRYEDLVKDIEKVSSDLENFTNGDFCFDLNKKYLIHRREETFDRSLVTRFLIDGLEQGLSEEFLVQL